MLPVEKTRHYAPIIDLANGPRRYNDSVTIIRDVLGVKPLTNNELGKLSSWYAEDLRIGAKKTGVSSLLMADTLLPRVDKERLPPDENVLIIEIGGTKIRAANAQTDQSGKISVDFNNPSSFIEESLGKTVFSSSSEFFDLVFEKLRPVLSKSKPASLGIIWSFPPKVTYEKKMNGYRVVDQTSSNQLPKNFVIPGIENKPVGGSIMTKLNESYGIKNIPYAVMNDTRAAEGGIVGTGFNLAFGRWNTESGGFNKFDRQRNVAPLIYQYIFDAMEGAPYLTEAQVSGKYLGELIKIVDVALSDGKLISQRITHNNSKLISVALGNSLREFRYNYPDPYLEATIAFLSNMATERSAQIVGTMIGTGICVFGDDYKGNIIPYPMEGSVIENVPGYRQKVEKYANRISTRYGKKVLIEVRKNAGIYGAATVALDLLK